MNKIGIWLLLLGAIAIIYLIAKSVSARVGAKPTDDHAPPAGVSSGQRLAFGSVLNWLLIVAGTLLVASYIGYHMWGFWTGRSEKVAQLDRIAAGMTPAQAGVVVSKPQSGSGSNCPLFSTDRATCDVGIRGSGYISYVRGAPTTLHFCWEPDADAVDTPKKMRKMYKDIIALTSDGKKVSYFSNPQPSDVIGYNFIPRKPITLMYYLGDC